MYQVPTALIIKRTDLIWKLHLFVTISSNTSTCWLIHKLEHVWKNNPWMFNSLNSISICLPVGIFLKIVINSDTFILLILIKIARQYFALFWQGQHGTRYYGYNFKKFSITYKESQSKKVKGISLSSSCQHFFIMSEKFPFILLLNNNGNSISHTLHENMPT